MLSTEEKIKLFIDRARSYIGVPFKHQGRDVRGLDCIGIVVVPLNELGFISYDNKNYKRFGLGGDLKNILENYCYEVDKKSKLKAGDILVFSKGNSQHLAIYTGNSIIHSNNFIGKVVEHDLDDEYYSMISRVYRYKEE